MNRPEVKETRSFLVSREPKENEEVYDVEDDTASSNTQDDTAQVFLRIRPLSKEQICANYKIKDNVLVATQSDVSTNNKNVLEKHFVFSDIFDGTINQSIVYENCVKSKIESEENLTVLTYGTSGSGKTFTLLGDLDKPGIIPRALENLFTFYANNIYEEPAVKVVNSALTLIDTEATRYEEMLRNTLLLGNAEIKQRYSKVQKIIDKEHDFETQDFPNKSVLIWISFVEIYNEVVYDLLNLDNTVKQKGLKVISNDGRVFIKNLTSIYVKSSLEAYELLTYGLKKVTYASTSINSHSSRSHCIFFVDVITYSHPDIFTHNTYKFCDLAGSERLGKTKNVGNRLKEAQRINTSLMVLGRCLDALYSNQQRKSTDVIPFRESKLTLILQTALIGKEKITMIVSITPTEEYYEENLGVLSFSSIAKNIIYKPSIRKHSLSTRYSLFTTQASISTHNSIVPRRDSLIEENNTLRKENERLRAEVVNLEDQLVKQEMQLRETLIDDFKARFKEQDELWERRLAQKEEFFNKTKQIYEDKLTRIKNYYERKIEDEYIRIKHEQIAPEAENGIPDVELENMEEDSGTSGKRRKLSSIENLTSQQISP